MAAFDREYIVPRESRTNPLAGPREALKDLLNVHAARQSRERNIEAAINKHQQATGQIDALALQKLQYERAQTERLGALLNSIAPVSHSYSDQQNRQIIEAAAAKFSALDRNPMVLSASHITVGGDIDFHLQRIGPIISAAANR
jgi:hypothetical protein